MTKFVTRVTLQIKWMNKHSTKDRWRQKQRHQTFSLPNKRYMYKVFQATNSSVLVRQTADFNIDRHATRRVDIEKLSQVRDTDYHHQDK